MRMHKALKLTVLPALDPAQNSTFSVDNKRKPTTTKVQGSMIEVDNSGTVEDDVRATIQANKKLVTAKPVHGFENKNRKIVKGKSQLETYSS